MSGDDVQFLRKAITGALTYHTQPPRAEALAALDRLAQERDHATASCVRERLRMHEERQRTVAAEEALAQTREALEQIVRWGTRFDAKGTHSKQVVEHARAALSRPPTVQIPPEVVDEWVATLPANAQAEIARARAAAGGAADKPTLTEET